MLKQKINLRMASQDAAPIINLVQNDTGREIECNILDFDIPAGAISKLWLIKPSKKISSCDGVISENMVTVALTDQVVAEKGMCVAQLKITKDGKTLSSFTMYFNFEEDTSTNGIISQEDIKLVETFIQEQKKKLDAYIAEKTKDVEKLKTDVGNLDASKADKTETAKLKEDIGNKAPAIIKKASGKTIIINDSSNLPIKALSGTGKIIITGKNILKTEKRNEFIPFEAKAGTLFTLITNGELSEGGNVRFVDENGEKIWFAINKGETKKTLTIKKNIKGYENLLSPKEGLKYCFSVGENDKYEEYVEQVITAPVDSEQLKTIHTNYPITVLTSENEISVEYVADTKHYIDKKFEELNQAIVNTQIALL